MQRERRGLVEHSYEGPLKAGVEMRWDWRQNPRPIAGDGGVIQAQENPELKAVEEESGRGQAVVQASWRWALYPL